MKGSKTKPELPQAIRAAQQQFELWRAHKKNAREQIPPQLWLLAVELSDTFGLHTVCKALGLSYSALKKHTSTRIAGPPKVAFVELRVPEATQVCWGESAETEETGVVIALNRPDGATMIVRSSSSAGIDLAGAVTAFVGSACCK